MSALSKNEPAGFQDMDEGGLPPLAGYISKLNRRGAYQKRYFVAKGRFLAYYKDESSLKVMACIDLKKVTDIFSNKELFKLNLGDRVYTMQAASAEEAKKWVKGLLLRQDGNYDSQGNFVVSDETHAEGDAEGELKALRKSFGQASEGIVRRNTFSAKDGDLKAAAEAVASTEENAEENAEGKADEEKAEEKAETPAEEGAAEPADVKLVEEAPTGKAAPTKKASMEMEKDAVDAEDEQKGDDERARSSKLCCFG